VHGNKKTKKSNERNLKYETDQCSEVTVTDVHAETAAVIKTEFYNRVAYACSNSIRPTAICYAAK